MQSGSTYPALLTKRLEILDKRVCVYLDMRIGMDISEKITPFRLKLP